MYLDHRTEIIGQTISGKLHLTSTGRGISTLEPVLYARNEGENIIWQFILVQSGRNSFNGARPVRMIRTSSRTFVFQARGALNRAKNSPQPFISFNLTDWTQNAHTRCGGNRL